MTLENEMKSVSVQDMRDEEIARMMLADDKVICEQDRALSVLSVAVNLFDDLQRGCSLTNRNTHLEEASKLTGVSPPIILYAYKYGTLQAHDLFVKEEMKCNKRVDDDGNACPPSLGMKE